MKKATRISPLWLATTIVCAGLVAAAWYIPQKEQEALAIRMSRAQQQKRATEEDLRPLHDFGSENLEKARTRAATFRSMLLSASAEATMLDAMRLNWKVAEDVTSDNVEYTCRLFTLTKIGTYVGEWPEILKSIQSFSKQGGVRVRSVQIQTLPDETRPVFSRIEIKVEIFTRSSSFTANLPTT